MRAKEFTESNFTRLTLTPRDNTRAKQWIQKVYKLYPYEFDRNHVMAWGEGADQQIAMFELEPSGTKEGAVEIKWISSYPHGVGAGTRAIEELQQLADEDGITLTLYPWTKGKMSQAKLTKFYKNRGFKPIAKGSKDMVWKPTRKVEEGWRHGAAALAVGLGGLAGLQQQDPTRYEPVARPTVSVDAPSVKQVVAPPVAEPTRLERILSVLNPSERILVTTAKKNGIVGEELVQFLAQCAHETGDFQWLSELGSEKRFARLYDLAHSPKKAKALGNVKPGDGAKYKGRGFIHLTGRYNYRKAGEALGLPLEENPELVEDPKIAAKTAVWYWKTRVQPRANDFADVERVTRLINPGMRGLDDRKEKFAKYSEIIGQVL